MSDKNKALTVNFPIGQRVVVRSNGDDPLMVGTVVCYESLGQAKSLFAVVKSDADSVDYLVMGVMHHWSEGKVEALNKLTPREQWNVMSIYAAKN